MLKVSLRGLGAHKFRLLLSVIAIVVSVGFMAGTQVLTATISTTFDKIFDDVNKDIDVVVRSSTEVDTGFGKLRSPVSQDLVPVVGRVEGVKAVEGQVQGQISILDKSGDPMGNANSGPPTFGLNWLTEPELNGWRLSSGAPPTAPDQVVIDTKTADKAGFVVGDTVKIQLNSGVRDFKLVGIAGFGTTKDYAGAAAALFEEKTAQTILVDEPDKFTWISVAGQDDVTQEQLRDRITAVLPTGTQAITGKAFTAESQDVFRQFFDVLGTALFVFGLVALFVGAFIIYNTFSIIVAQRTRELALLRAMGASRKQVLGSVTFEGFVVGVVSSLVGLVFGIGLAAVLLKLLAASGGGVEVDGITLAPAAFVSSFLVGLLITVGSALFPAWRAARVPPVAAMRDVAIDTTGSSRPRLYAGLLITVLGALSMYLGLFGQGENKLAKTGIGIGLIFLGAIVLGPLFSRPLSGAIGYPLRWFSGRLARANAMRNPKRTAATASALMIGVGLIVMFSILTESLRSSVSAGIDTAFTADLIVDSQSQGLTGLSPEITKTIDATPGVATSVGIAFGFAKTADGSGQVVGSDLTKLPEAIRMTVLQGSFADLAPDEIAVSKHQADDRHWALGESVPMTFLQGGPQQLKVGAIYEIKDLDRGLGYLMTTEGFNAHFPPQFQNYNQVFIRTEPGVSAETVQAALKPEIKQQFPTAVVQNLAEYRDAQTGFFTVILSIVSIMLILAVGIAILGIINTLLLSVYERTREIGLLRAIGMVRIKVGAMVTFESVIFSLQGTAIGTGIGFLFAWALIRALKEQSNFISFAIPWIYLVVMVILASIAGVIAAVIPAWSASRLKVLDAIATD